ncbi:MULTISPECIES: flagellar protein FlaG [Mesobacillus]|uniref:flagellar protein FlaG n=1 Tax=Mesobacillus TaxID=2675231 RepID=UPI00177C13D5|nr:MULTISPECIES: flagellar protein FlaG [Mesobacillus]MCM3574103.1 flagellar protein FlaG [Mesobacillus subterraneus]UYZ21604.1 flagellar protein FlaG [Mesobacillus jeotgali]
MISSLSSNTSGSYIYETIKTKIDSIDSGSQTVAEENAAQVPVQEESQSIPKEKMEGVVEGLNKYLMQSNTALKFQYHEKLQEYYVTLVDEKTKEIVREIPPKKMLDFYAAMTEFLGLIVDKKI